MTEPTLPEDGDRVAARSEALNAVVSFTHDAGGPAAAAYVAGQMIKTAGEVITTKINANVEIIKAVNNPGHSQQE
jgi:hypothetical protein